MPEMNAIWLAVLSAALTFVGVAFWKVYEGKKALLVRVTELEKQTSIVKEAVVPITAAFQAILIKKLTHFHTPVMDKLMEKLGPPVTLTEMEEIQLIEELQKREIDLNGMIDEAERDAARMLPLVMRMVKAESEIFNPDVKLQIVASVTSTDIIPEPSAANSPRDAMDVKKDEEK